MLYGLKEKHISTIQAVFKKYTAIEEALLYGSRAKGNYRNGSDIDLTLKGKKLTRSLLATIQMELEDSDLPYQVDVSIYDFLTNLKLIDHIGRIGISFYKREIMNEWKEVKLGELIEIKYGKDHKKLSDGKIPCIGSGGIMRYVNSFLYDKVSILIPRKGSLNNIMFRDKPFWTVDTMFWSKINDEIVEPKFLYYQLTLIDYTNLNVGSAVPSLTVPVISDIDISLPPLTEQKAIAEVLSSLDDKIDLLNRQNKTLEQMAETLFRKWFIEEVDDCWEEKPLSKIADFLNGLACQKYPPQDEFNKLPVLKIKDLRNGISESSDWCTTDIDEKYIVQNGDIIFSWSASLMVKIWNGQKCILNQHLFKVTSEEFPKWFIYLWSKHHLNEFIAIAKAHATTMGHIKRGDLDEAMVVVPSDNELNGISLQIEPLIEKIIENNKQIHTLEKMRDTLLPKLMSGEVRVDVE